MIILYYITIIVIIIDIVIIVIVVIITIIIITIVVLIIIMIINASISYALTNCFYGYLNSRSSSILQARPGGMRVAFNNRLYSIM